MAIAATTASPVDTYRGLLGRYFGFPDFRDGQERVLRELAQHDVLAVMPTGSGKSMCYVLPALASGRTLVVLLMAIALACYGFWISLAGRPLFAKSLLPDQVEAA